MFNIDISDPMFQGMVQEEEDKDKCPKCGSQLNYNSNTKQKECSNDSCNYKIKIRTR